MAKPKTIKKLNILLISKIKIELPKLPLTPHIARIAARRP